MKILFSKKAKEVYLHILFWVFLIAFNHFFTTLQETTGSKTPFRITFIRYFLITFVFYAGAYFVFPFCFSSPRKNIVVIVLVIALFIISNFLFRYVFIAFVAPVIFNTPKPEAGLWHYFTFSLYWWFQYSLLGLGYWYARRVIKSERLLRASETERLQLENQKLQLQYNFLQAQINPHFLYNTIGFFHSKAMRFSKETAKGMELLSDIMRYSLQPATSDGKVPLKDEVKHLRNYIELHQMRFENALNIDFTQSGNLDGMRIPPHVLITLVENAFKHGIFNENNPPLKIDLSADNGHIFFTVSNKVSNGRNGARKESSGIGLSNIQSRLEKEYGNKSQLSYKNENGMFNVQLNIDA